MKVRRLWFLLLALGPASTACGGGEEPDVTVTLRDDGITLSVTSVAAGELRFEGVNEGTVTHEFEVFEVPGGVDANALPMDGDVATADETLTVIDEVEDLAPGTSAPLNLALEPGNYAVLCNLPGHYANGMHTTFTVS
jgi:uncharacterized cupredoxin-like copper-binding protein